MDFQKGYLVIQRALGRSHGSGCRRRTPLGRTTSRRTSIFKKVWSFLRLRYSELKSLALAIRVEYLKSRARANRWSEEVELLEEEKRRTLEFFGWKRRWWTSHSTSSIGGIGADYIEGFAAFAHSQARVYEELEETCRDRWSRPLKTRKGKNPVLDVLEDDD